MDSKQKKGSSRNTRGSSQRTDKPNNRRPPRRFSRRSRSQSSEGQTGGKKGYYNREKRTRPQQPGKPPTPPAGYQPAEIKEDPTYSKAARKCDFVIKGGLASAIVHTAAATELAKTYRFNSIGGSGAGSVAAALIAAAETGRKAKGGGFARLHEALQRFGDSAKHQKIALFDLIKPDKKTEKYFDVARELLSGLKPHELGLPFFSLLKKFPSVFLLTAIPGLLVAGLALLASPWWAQVLMALAGLGMAATLPTVVARQRIISSMNKDLSENAYGFAKGMRPGDGGESLAEWLHLVLKELAGKKGREPLLFGDLHYMDDDERRDLDLQLQATDISINRPLRFPEIETASYQSGQVYYFNPEELSEYFPEDVVDALVKNARKQKQYRRLKGYLPLPETNRMPVAFAARCSMSIPILFSAVPLYRAVRISGRGRGRWEPRRSWIVGGELSGTFDVDAFDKPLPHHPTFAIHVSPIGSDDESREEQLKGIWVQNLITHNGPTLWREFSDMRGFMRAGLYTAKNWHEGVLLDTPGYRERIAVAKISQQQTGLFPAIDAKAYHHLLSLGTSIGSNLVNRFAEKSTRKFAVSWEAHRWIRFRRQMAALENQMLGFREKFYNSLPEDTSFEGLIMRQKDEAPHAFPWADIAQRNHALRITLQLLKLIEGWDESPASFIDKKAPYDEGDTYNNRLR